MYNMYAFWICVSSAPVPSLPGMVFPSPFQYVLPAHMFPGPSGVEYQARFVEQHQGLCIFVCVCVFMQVTVMIQGWGKLVSFA